MALSIIKKAFDFESKQLRIYGTPDTPWFCGKDVCRILGYKNITSAIHDNVDAEDRTFMTEVVAITDHQKLSYNDAKTTYINESGLYSLILRSKLDKAKTFKRWITAEVLPSIRKNGYYIDSNISDERIKQLERELKEKDDTIKQKTSELEMSKHRLIKLKEYVRVTRELKKEEIFYLATTKLYAQNNRFEYGGVLNIKDLNARLLTYNTGRAEGDLYYYAKIIECHKYKNIENCLDMLAKSLKDKIDSKKEMVHMRYDCFLELIEFIVENHNKSIDFINKHIARFINDTADKTPIVPEPVDLKDYVVIKRRKGGLESEIQRIDVSDWPEEKINTLIKKIINEHVSAKLGKDYDFDSQKNTDKVELIWKEFQKSLEVYTGKNKLGWRGAIKSVLHDAQKFAVKWRS